MAYASKVLYTGDGATKNFNIPFPYLSSSHLMVFVNDALQLNPMHYRLSGSTVVFEDAPGVDAAVTIKRNTSPNNTLVDFTDGSVLREADLDTAYLHNYYLLQETTDSFNEAINNALVDVATGAGIIETETQAVIAALVNEMLNQSAADTLQQRVNDIDANGESLLEVQTDVQLLGITSADNTAFIMNSQTVLIDTEGGETVAEWLNKVVANETSVTQHATAIADVEAKYGVSLNVNGYVTGFVQNNDGQSGNFIVLADRFAVVDPSGDPMEPEYIPFSIDNGKIVMTGDVAINGQLILNGSVIGAALAAGTIGSTQIGANAITTTQLNANAVTASKIATNAVTAGKINVTNLAAVNASLGQVDIDASGHLKGGQTGYDAGSGFFLGHSGGDYKFSIGDSQNALLWDGSNLIIRGGTFLGEGLFLNPFTVDHTVSDNSNGVKFGLTAGTGRNILYYEREPTGFPGIADQQWLFGGNSREYEAKWTEDSNTNMFLDDVSANTLSAGVWHDLDTISNAKGWRYTTGIDQSGTVTGTLQVRKKSQTSVGASATVTINITDT